MPMENVSGVHLSFEHGRWSLQVSLTKDFQMQQPDDIKEEKGEETGC